MGNLNLSHKLQFQVKVRLNKFSQEMTQVNLKIRARITTIQGILQKICKKSPMSGRRKQSNVVMSIDQYLNPDLFDDSEQGPRSKERQTLNDYFGEKSDYGNEWKPQSPSSSSQEEFKSQVPKTETKQKSQKHVSEEKLPRKNGQTEQYPEKEQKVGKKICNLQEKSPQATKYYNIKNKHQAQEFIQKMGQKSTCQYHHHLSSEVFDMSFYSKKEATMGIELVSKALSSENDTLSILKSVQTTEKVLLEYFKLQQKKLNNPNFVSMQLNKWKALQQALKNQQMKLKIMESKLEVNQKPEKKKRSKKHQRTQELIQDLKNLRNQNKAKSYAYLYRLVHNKHPHSRDVIVEIIKNIDLGKI